MYVSQILLSKNFTTEDVRMLFILELLCDFILNLYIHMHYYIAVVILIYVYIIFETFNYVVDFLYREFTLCLALICLIVLSNRLGLF